MATRRLSWQALVHHSSLSLVVLTKRQAVQGQQISVSILLYIATHKLGIMHFHCIILSFHYLLFAGVQSSFPDFSTDNIKWSIIYLVVLLVISRVVTFVALTHLDYRAT